MVTLKAPTLEKQNVIEALYLLYGQDYKAGGWNHDRDRKLSRWKGRGYAAFDEDDGQWPVEASWNDEGAYYEADEWAVDDYMPATMVKKSHMMSMVNQLMNPMNSLNNMIMPMRPTWTPGRGSNS